jgi:hypothetical protein
MGDWQSSSPGPTINPNQRLPKSIAPITRNQSTHSDRAQKYYGTCGERVRESTAESSPKENPKNDSTGELHPETAPTMFVFFRCHVIAWPNDQGQRRAPVADDGRFVSERIGWLPLAAPSCSPMKYLEYIWY